MNDVISLILGGGRGSRLYPLTLSRAKPAVSFAGKYRLIDIPVSNCINSGIKRVFVLTQFLSASLNRHIMRTYNFDLFTDGFVDILAAEQTPQRSDWFQGTADAVRATLGHTSYYRPGQVLILSGDHLYRMDYRRFVEHHRSSDAQLTLCVYPVSRDQAPRMGLLKADASGRVERFVEKPQDPAVLAEFRARVSLPSALDAAAEDGTERYLASMGVYVFEPSALQELLADGDQTDFGNEIIPGAIERGYRVMVYPFTDYWEDIGTIGSFFSANIALAQPDPPFQLYQPLWPFYTRPRSLPPIRVIGSDSRDSLLVEGSDIEGASISDSVIGVRSVVRSGTRLRDVVMHGADYYEGEQTSAGGEPPRRGQPPLGIGRGCRIERAIIDKDARIGDGVVIRDRAGALDQDARDGELFWVRDGVTVIPKGTVIPAGTEI